MVRAIQSVPLPMDFDPDAGAFPEFRTGGDPLVVCQDDTKQRIKQNHGPMRARQQRLLAKCRYDSIQDAVNDAENGTRILVLPGIYEEQGSRGPAPAGCEDVYERTENGQFALTYDEQRQCPNAGQHDAPTPDENRVLVDSGDREIRVIRDDIQTMMETTGRWIAKVSHASRTILVRARE